MGDMTFDRDGFDDRIWEVFGLDPRFDRNTRLVLGNIAEQFATSGDNN